MVDHLGRYELKEVLGHGSFATVWRAHDPVVGVDVALKVLADNWAVDDEMRDRFLAEARLSLEIDSPRMIRVHVVNETDEGIPYIVMSLADRGTLFERMQGSPGRYSRFESLRVIQEVALSLADVHRHGLIHRDIKPANILYQKDVDGERLVLGDFGLARSVDNTSMTRVSGSPAYMAPEQAAGLSKLDARVDLYPLGVMLVELMTGEPPDRPGGLHGAAAEVVYDIPGLFAASGTPVDDGLAELIAALLQPRPEDRLQSATAVVARIDTLLAREPTEVAATAPDPAVDGEADEHRNGLHRVLFGALVALVAVGALIVGVLGFDRLGGDSEQASFADPVVVTTEPAPGLAGPTSVATERIPVDPPAVEVELAPEIPNPPGAVLNQFDSVSGETRILDTAGPIEEVVAFYEQLEGWLIVGNEPAGDGVTLVITNGDVAAHLTLTPAGSTPAINVTNIRMVGTDVPTGR